MQEPAYLPPGLTTESEIFHFFEEERRLRLARNAAPLLSLLAASFAASIVIFARFAVNLTPRQGRTLLLIAVVVGLAAVSMGYATYVAQQGRGRLAANITTFSVGLGLLISTLLWLRASGLDPLGLTFLFLFSLVIVLVGLFSGLRTMLATAAGSCVLIIVLVAVAASDGVIKPGVEQELNVVIPFIIFIVWAFTGLALGILSNYQNSLRELSRLYAQVKQIDEIKDQFITVVNHELRNPIMAMAGYIDILRLRQRAMSDERRDEILLQAGRVGDRVGSLLESILDARRLDQGADDFTPAPVAVRATLEASLQLINPREGIIGDRDLLIDIPDGLLVWGDETRLQQVFSNLISNALKYSAPDTPISIRAMEIEDPVPVAGRTWSRLAGIAPVGAHRVVEITVQDHGLGIPPDQIPLLFRRFVRLPRDLASTVIGNGLGLHLCRVFVEAMRGRIWIESAGVPGEGSTFHITLPLPPTDYVLANGMRPHLNTADGEAASAGA